MAGFNAEVKKRTTELTTGIHLATIIDASIVKGLDGKPKLTEKGEMGIMIKYADGKNHIFEQVYYTSGDREYFFKKMCTAANIDLEVVKKTGKFKAEAVGKRLWIYIKEVYDIDGENTVKDDITGEPVINYYVFNTSFMGNPDNKPAMKGDPARNNGIATDDFVDYRQIFKAGASIAEKAHAAISKDNEEDFADIYFDTKPKLMPGKPDAIIYGSVSTSKGEVAGNKAFVDTWTKSVAIQPNNDFTEQKEKPAIHFEEEEIDFDDL